MKPLGGSAVRRSPPGVWVGALLVAVAACAGEPEPPPEEPAPTRGVHGTVAASVRSVPSIVTLHSDAAVAPERTEPPRIDQLGLQFSPRRLIVWVEEPVLFTNSEALQHNVTLRSIDRDSTVLSADTPSGESLTFTFQEVGAYDVLCEIHPGMSAVVFVTDASYTVFAEDDGTFEIPNAAPGEYTLRVWSVDPELRAEQTIVVSAGAATEVTTAPLG